MTASELNVFAKCLFIDKITKFVSRAWLMVDLKYDLINLSLEKLATLTHIGKNMRNAMDRLGRRSENSHLIIHKIYKASQLLAFFVSNFLKTLNMTTKVKGL